MSRRKTGKWTVKVNGKWTEYCAPDERTAVQMAKDLQAGREICRYAPPRRRPTWPAAQERVDRRDEKRLTKIEAELVAIGATLNEFRATVKSQRAKPPTSEPIAAEPAAEPAPTPQPDGPEVTPEQLKLAGWVFTMLSEYFQSIGAAKAGHDAIDFMRSHAGCTIVVPIMPIIERIATEQQIIRTAARDPFASNQSIAEFHGMPTKDVTTLIRRQLGTREVRTAKYLAGSST